MRSWDSETQISQAAMSATFRGCLLYTSPQHRHGLTMLLASARLVHHAELEGQATAEGRDHEGHAPGE